MGREDTKSKLHRDNGGLEISIAPIVGEKECILVHRSDGASCFYNLNASLDDIDLHTYPLMAYARVWKTTVKPGEILLMPHGTYHQCRNVTPCLSYSRFHLDSENLLAFLQSMLDQDAPEIDHGEVLWNSSVEIIKKIDAFFDESQAKRKKRQPLPELNAEMKRLVVTLQKLRHCCRELARRYAIQSQMNKAPTVSTLRSREQDQHSWDRLVDDIDLCLHEFRYRMADDIPPFRPRRTKEKNRISYLKTTARVKTGCHTPSSGIVAFDTDAESAFLLLPKVTLQKRPMACFKRAQRMRVGERVMVYVHGRKVNGTILEIQEEMQAAYLTYDGFPIFYDDFQPFERLRNSRCGAELPVKAVQPGIVVSTRWGEYAEEYRATVIETRCTLFFNVRLDMIRSSIDRWFPYDMIVPR
jgi:hypothetical protein